MKHFTRPSAVVVFAAFATALAMPSVSLAKSLCIFNSASSGHIVVPRIKMKPGAVSPIHGYYSPSSSFNPLYGAVARSSDGTRFGFSLEVGNSVISSGAISSGPAGTQIVSVAFGQSDSSLDVGDTATGFFAGSFAVFTIEDCADAPPLP